MPLGGGLPRLLVEDVDDPAFLRHFAHMGLTPAQEAELVAVLKRLALPMEQVIAQGCAGASSGNGHGTNGAGPSPPSALAAPPLSFFPASSEAMVLMTGMGLSSRGQTAGAAAAAAAAVEAAAKGDRALESGESLPPPPPPVQQQRQQLPPSSSSAAAGNKTVLVTLSRDRGRGARLFYPSRLAAPGSGEEEEVFRQEVLRLVTACLLPLLAVEGGPKVDAADWEIDWKPALSYRKTVLRLTGGMPTVVLVRAGDGAEGEIEGLVETGAEDGQQGGGRGTPVLFDVLVKGVMLNKSEKWL